MIAAGHFESLGRIVIASRGMELKDVDYDLVVSLCGNPGLAIMYQAARNLDAQRLDANAHLEGSDVTVDQRVSK